MAWYSVLPDHLTVYETWIIRTFIFLAVVNMAPWLSLIVYDFVLYVFRTIYFEVPVIGGRARGDVRPRAPSLVDGRRRLSFAEMITSGSSPRNSNSSQQQIRNRGQHIGRIEENAVEDEPEKS